MRVFTDNYIPDHVVGVDDLRYDFIYEINDRAAQYKSWRLDGHRWDRGRFEGTVLATAFFEPSTRTRLSFEAAMSYLGGSVISTENAAEFSSFKKGESLSDNFKVISGYCDIIVGRFRNGGEAKIAADASLVPLINGGDGMAEHPTQAMIDYFTIDEYSPTSTPMVTFVGDNRRSRTVRSLAKLLAKCTDIDHLNFISPPELAPDDELLMWLKAQEIEATVTSEMSPALIESSDVIYMTRSQNERGDYFAGESYALTPAMAERMHDDAIILHPLPRLSELPTELDDDCHSKYFEQARNGLYVRMALIEAMLS